MLLIVPFDPKPFDQGPPVSKIYRIQTSDISLSNYFEMLELSYLDDILYNTQPLPVLVALHVTRQVAGPGHRRDEHIFDCGDDI